MAWHQMSFPHSLPSSTQVLIVGAGPVGLVCAITLAREGQKVTIVDAVETNANGCRAVNIHSNTLETLDTIGCGQVILDASFKVSEMCLYEGTATRFVLPTPAILRNKFGAKFPYICTIPQYETERIFREELSKLGVEVIRGKRLVSYSEAEDSVEAHFEDGSSIRAKYLVGADGSRSAVRNLAGMTFKDPHTRESHYSPGAKPASADRAPHMILADLRITGYLPESSLNRRFSIQLGTGQSARYMLCPVPVSINTSDRKPQDHDNATLFRFGTILEEGEGPEVPDKAFIQSLLDKGNPWPERIVIDELYTATRYRAKSAITNSFFRGLESGGKIILAGDAAHIHPPFGGQGMNLGICDSVELGRAIAKHARQEGKDGDDLLLAYAERRMAIAMRVIGLANGLEGSMNTKKPWARVLRNVMLYVVWCIPWLQQRMVWRISGLANRE